MNKAILQSILPPHQFFKMENKPNLSTINGFSDVLKNYNKSIAQLLQNKYGISVEEFYVTCVNAVKKEPKLLQCDPKSLFGAILLCAEIGLRPNTPDGHAFILPYGKEAKFQIGYKGLLLMAYRNPRVESIYGEAVFENDLFDYGYGLNPYLTHKPFRGGDRGSLVATYSVCKLKDADPIFTVVEKNELALVENLSKSAMGSNSKYSPYHNGTDVHNYMQIKVAFKKISKIIPQSSGFEFSTAIDYDSRFQGGAKVIVEIPSDSNEIVEPTIMDGSKSMSSLQNTFDDIDALSNAFETEQELPKEIPAKEVEIVTVQKSEVKEKIIVSQEIPSVIEDEEDMEGLPPINFSDFSEEMNEENTSLF